MSDTAAGLSAARAEEPVMVPEALSERSGPRSVRALRLGVGGAGLLLTLVLLVPHAPALPGLWLAFLVLLAAMWITASFRLELASGIGTVTFVGVGFSHDDVAVWLESLAKQKGYKDPYFSNSTEALIGTRKTVNFTSTVTLTPEALSGAYTAPAGG